MKRFILCSLSATIAVALGSVARAAETTTMSEAQVENNLLAQSVEDSYDSEAKYAGLSIVAQTWSAVFFPPTVRGPITGLSLPLLTAISLKR